MVNMDKSLSQLPIHFIKIKTEIDVTHGAKHQRAIGSLHRPRPEKILSVMN